MATPIKVLLLTYYWPPAGGGGVHRWLKMSKYIPDMGCALTVYTPSNPEYPAVDASASADVRKDIRIIKQPITEPYTWYKRFTGKKKEEKVYSGFINEKESFTQKLSVWLRGNFFIPDARMLWIKPSIKYLTKLMKSSSFDVVISTGPPHSMHMIGLGIKKAYPDIKWIADFRDPWTGIDFYDQLRLGQRADRKHHQLEKSVLVQADKVVTVSRAIARDLSELAGNREVDIILNGFDHEDFEKSVDLNPYFNIVYLGSMNADRNPTELWDALSLLRQDSTIDYNEVKVEITGQVDGSVKRYIDKQQLNDIVTYSGFVDHEKAIHRMQSARVLLLVINKSVGAEGILTGKAFEYLGSGRPILCIGPKSGDMKELLAPFVQAQYVGFDDVEACKEAVTFFYNNYIDNKDKTKKGSNIEAYSRKGLAAAYVQLIKSLAS